MPSRKYHRRSYTTALPDGSRIFVYCRYSGEQQDDRSQRMELERAIEEHHWQLVEWFQDDARSGSSDRRPGWQALIARSHDAPRPADGIVAWKGDRISRDQLDASYYKADLRRRGYVLHFLADELPDGPMQPLFESLLQWKAEQDLRDISANTIRGQQAVVRMEVAVDGQTRTGFSSGGFPPRGYRRSAPIRTGQRRNGDPRFNVLWEPDPALWATCRRAVEMLLAGATYQAICAETSLFAQSGHLSTWFRSEALYGRRQHGDTVIEDVHERLITAEEEPLVRARLDVGQQQQAQRHPRRLASNWLLSGIIHCGYCLESQKASAMWGLETTKGRWYRCRHRHDGVDGYRLVPAVTAEQLVIDAVSSRLTIDVYRPVLAAAQRAYEEQHTARSAMVTQIKTEITRLEHRAREIARALGDGYSAALRQELAETEEQLERLRHQRLAQSPIRRLTEHDLETFLEDAKAMLTASQDLPQRRRALSMLITRIDAYGDKLVLHWLSPQVAYNFVPPAEAKPNATVLMFREHKRRQRAPFIDDLVRARLRGMTYAALGAHYGISPQRAQRIYARWRRESAG